MQANIEAKYRLLVYGIESKGLTAPSQSIDKPKYELLFGTRTDSPRFQDFDGVILFQGTFESFERVSDGYRSHLRHTCDWNELDKRTKELKSLRGREGLVSMLLCQPFIDHGEDARDYREFHNSDLSKRLLQSCSLRWVNLGARETHFKIYVNEFSRFFGLYGGATAFIQPEFGIKSAKTLASLSGNPVSIVSYGNVFIVPTLLPRNSPEHLQEFFIELAEAVLQTWEKLRHDLPPWIEEYSLPEEAGLLVRQKELTGEIGKIESKLAEFRRYKRILVTQGDPLVDAVIDVLENRIGVKTTRKESFREDLSVCNDNNEEIALVEVKGTNGGVQREHINQADSHRERAGKPPEFPSILIINTKIKGSASIVDKDLAVAPEQVLHAVKNNVLVVRTLDLLNLSSMYASGRLTREQLMDLLTKSKGWLKATGLDPELLQQ